MLELLPQIGARMVRYRCVSCNNVWGSKVDPIRCAKCRSYDIMEEKKYQRFLAEVRRLSPDNPRLRLLVLREKLKADGFRFNQSSTLNIVERVFGDIFSPTPVGATVALGEISLPVKKVKKEK